MRITIDTDDPAGAKTQPAQAASDLHPTLDAGAAPIEHIRRMSSGAGAQANGADFRVQAPSIEQDSAVDGGRSSHPAASRSGDGDGDKAQDLPLNPLRAGAALAVAQRSAAAPKHELSVAATDAGSAAAVTTNVEPPASKTARPSSAKAVKTQSKP